MALTDNEQQAYNSARATLRDVEGRPYRRDDKQEAALMAVALGLSDEANHDLFKTTALGSRENSPTNDDTRAIVALPRHRSEIRERLEALREEIRQDQGAVDAERVRARQRGLQLAGSVGMLPSAITNPGATSGQRSRS